jgi:hypothetical protein
MKASTAISPIFQTTTLTALEDFNMLTLGQINDHYTKVEVENVQLDYFSLGNGDHGVMSSFIGVKGDGWGQGFGGYSLKGERTYKWLDAIFKTLELSDIKYLKQGVPLRVVRNGNGFASVIVGIGHFYKDQWFCPDIEWKS